MKAKIADLAGVLFVLALAVVLPVLAGVEIEKWGYTVDFAGPAVIM